MYTSGVPKACWASFRLQDERITDALGLLGQLLVTFHHAVASRDRRQTRRLHLPSRSILFSHHFDHFGLWPYERDLGCLANLRKIRVFRKKAISRMDGIHIRDFGGANHVGNVQVALAAARRPDAHGFVGKANM